METHLGAGGGVRLTTGCCWMAARRWPVRVVSGVSRLRRGQIGRTAMKGLMAGGMARRPDLRLAGTTVSRIPIQTAEPLGLGGPSAEVVKANSEGQRANHGARCLRGCELLALPVGVVKLGHDGDLVTRQPDARPERDAEPELASVFAFADR